LIVRVMAILALVLGALVAVPTAANAAANDAVIKSQTSSVTNLGVCHSLSSDTTCSNRAWPPPTLSPGQNTLSKFGWADTDAIFCGFGYICQINSSYFTGSGSGTGTRLIKVSGCWGCTIYVIVHRL
jgi:hypothetical protein